MSPFYAEDDSELASEIAFRILLHIRNKFGYTPYRLPVEIYIFWQNPSIIDFRKNCSREVQLRKESKVQMRGGKGEV
jgi:hypothetical protein